MFALLEKYKNKGSFEFRAPDSLKIICNAPKTKGCIYMVYHLFEKENLIYIGSSGWVNQDGSLGLRNNGMWDRIVNGKQTFILNGIETTDKRCNIWKRKMKEDGIEKLRVDWFVTYNEEIKHIPAFAEATLIQQYFDVQGKLPSWNKCF